MNDNDEEVLPEISLSEVCEILGRCDSVEMGGCFKDVYEDLGFKDDFGL